MGNAMQVVGGGGRGIRAQQHDPRFRQLVALAEAGDECAAADLFKEFDYVFPGGEEGSGHDAD